MASQAICTAFRATYLPSAVVSKLPQVLICFQMELFTKFLLLVFDTGVVEKYRSPVELNLCRFAIASN